jgi:WD40 repeat protein
MASTGERSEVKLWHFKSDMRPFRYTRHAQSVYACQYSPCGGYLATGGQDGKVFIWKNVAEGNKYNHNFRAHAGPVKSVRFSKDGNFLVTAGDDKIIKLYKVFNGYKKTKFIRSFVGHTNWVLKADISADTNLIASICDKTVRLWDATDGKQILRYKNVESGNRCLEIHPEGNYVAIGGSKGLLQIWDIRASKLAQVYDTGDAINELTFHPSGQFIATAHDYSESKNNSVLKIFDIRQGRCIYRITGVYGSLYGLRFSIEGDYLASAGTERLVYVWKTNFKPMVPLLQGEEEQVDYNHWQNRLRKELIVVQHTGRNAGE